MSSIEVYKIALLYDYKVSLNNGMKNYTFDKACDFAIKLCNKNFFVNDENIVKLLISKNILNKIDLSSGLLNLKEENYSQTISFIKEHYSSNVVKFMEIVLNDPNYYKNAYDLLETLDDWLVIYQFISFARLHAKLLN
jgi:hypothetical protein